MTDRYNSLTVVLEQNMRSDDAVPILQAISMIRGVLTVTGNVADPDSCVAESRARHDIASKVLEALKPKEGEQCSHSP